MKDGTGRTTAVLAKEALRCVNSLATTRAHVARLHDLTHMVGFHYHAAALTVAAAEALAHLDAAIAAFKAGPKAAQEDAA